MKYKAFSLVKKGLNFERPPFWFFWGSQKSNYGPMLYTYQGMLQCISFRLRLPAPGVKLVWKVPFFAFSTFSGANYSMGRRPAGFFLISAWSTPVALSKLAANTLAVCARKEIKALELGTSDNFFAFCGARGSMTQRVANIAVPLLHSRTGIVCK